MNLKRRGVEQQGVKLFCVDKMFGNLYSNILYDAYDRL